MLKNTTGKKDTRGFKLVPESWLTWLRKVPFGGALGVALAGALLWFAPHLIPEGWKVEAVVGLFLAAGVVVHRLGEALFGWFAEPVTRHLRARWEAALQKWLDLSDKTGGLALLSRNKYGFSLNPDGIGYRLTMSKGARNPRANFEAKDVKNQYYTFPVPTGYTDQGQQTTARYGS